MSSCVVSLIKNSTEWVDERSHPLFQSANHWLDAHGHPVLNDYLPGMRYHLFTSITEQFRVHAVAYCGHIAHVHRPGCHSTAPLHEGTRALPH